MRLLVLVAVLFVLSGPAFAAVPSPPEKPIRVRALKIPPPPAMPEAKLCPMDGAPWEEGEASHYADMLAGSPTAFGGAYDPDGLTAAHLSLPEGTRIMVRNLDNRKSVILTVTDRGPFAGGRTDFPRIIDVSGRAARILGFYGGIAPVALHRCGG
ncbi:MAG: hypothetical protein H6862_02935 [Rhodospirillales bacterium]|nr:hypothetical protein [Rhodospirillales bacterium]